MGFESEPNSYKPRCHPVGLTSQEEEEEENPPEISTSSGNKMESTEIAVLKEKFSTAQTVFCKKANRLSVAVDIPEKEVFIKDIGELCIEFSRLHDAGWDYIEALGESEDENGEAAQAREKITKCLASCVESLQLARETLWSKYASDEIQLYADSAEKECVDGKSARIASNKI